MNLNILSYIIYGAITVFIIYYVGRLFYTSGRIFILRLFHNHESLTDTTNHILLLAYYLFNIGYAIVQFSFWQKIHSVEGMISSVCGKTGVLVFILAVTHYINLLVIYFLSTASIIHSQKIKP